MVQRMCLASTSATTPSRSRHVRVERLRVDSADVRGRVERPHGFGVEALQGAFTLWNEQPDRAVVITAELLDIAAGSIESPIRGSGVFVGGHGDWEGKANGGTVRVSILRTGPICANGGIPAGTPDVISGGVFVISGAVVDDVVNLGPVATLGANDMVLDDWGDVRNWTAKAPVTSRGPNGIGFVNFGAMERLDVQAPIETFGPGARGFNLHDGSLERSSFASIATHGDGSIGIQVSKALPLLEVAGDISTDGGEGQSLVKGVRVVLKAVALSIKPGGRVGSIKVGGRIHTGGSRVVSVATDGEVGHLDVAGGIVAEGDGADGVHARGTVPGLHRIEVRALRGRRLLIAAQG